VTKDIETLLQLDSILTDTLTKAMFFIFSPPHKKNEMVPVAHMAHCVLPNTQASASQNPKSHFLPSYKYNKTDSLL